MEYLEHHGLGERMFNNMNMMFIESVKREGGEPELRAVIGRQNRILVGVGVTSRTTMSSSNLERPDPEPADRNRPP
ncbi:hypothetical protein NKH52_27125 [Mesorhizobium sp. M1066]|uniref:hypothetical protein n=1 Tax=unclassified Mesorhizobium TaxID=325217 RepID=UPI00333B6D83